MTKLTEGLYCRKKHFYHRGFLPLPRGPIHVYDHYFQTTILETAWPIKPKLYVEPSWKRECKFCEKGLTQMTKMAAMPIYGKI